MKFLADENYPMPSVTLLRRAGQEVEHMAISPEARMMWM